MYRSVPGKRPLPGKCPCTLYLISRGQCSSFSYGNYIPGKRPCGPKSRCMFTCPWALTRDTTVCGLVYIWEDSLVSSSTYMYCSAPGKRPWALKHNLQFRPAWALTRDQNPIRLCRSCYSAPLKCGTWALTREWALARDTMVHASPSIHIQSDHIPKYYELNVP